MIDSYERDELAAIDYCTRRYMAVLGRHPDCRDPDHPGCPACEYDDDEDNNEEGGDDESE